MKKSNLLIALLGVVSLTGLIACDGGASSPTSQTSIDPSDITSVTINGSRTVDVGKTTTLSAGVAGDPSNSVTWSSSDETIATVASNGVVTGIKAGTVTITATSTYNTSISGTWTLQVVAATTNPTSMTVTIDEGEGITYNENTGIYQIAANTEFQLKYQLDVPNPTEAVEIYYRIAPTTTSSTDYSSFVEVDRATGLCAALRAFSASTSESYITLQVVYTLSVDTQVIGSVRIDVIDERVNDINTVNKILSKSNDAEVTRMNEISLTRKITNNEDTTKDISLDYDLFGNGSYASYKDNKNGTTASYFNGNKDGNYYNIQYKPELNVITKGTEGSVGNNDSLIYDYDREGYGLINNVMENIVSGTTYNSVLSFNADSMRSEIVLVNTSTNVSLTATNEVEGYGLINLSLTLDLDSEGLVTKYTFSASMDGDKDITIEEEATITYASSKTETDADYDGYLDLQGYYIMQNFNIENMEGRSGDGYNFVNSGSFERYLSQDYEIHQTEYDGVQYDTFTMSPDQSFAFKVDEDTVGNPNVSLNLDNVVSSLKPITAESTSGEETSLSPVCVVTSYNEGIFAVSNRFDNLGNALMGRSLVTLTSTNKFTYSFIIEYTDYPDPTEIMVDAPNVEQIDGEYYFSDTAVNDVTDETFLLNTLPDTLDLEFGLHVEDEDGTVVNDALELYSHDPGNPDGKLGYSIKGLKEGTYNFYIYIVGFEDIHSEMMHINIIPQMAEQEVIAGITGEAGYDYPGLSTVSVNFKFNEDKTLVITQEVSGVTYQDTVNYEIVNGDVMIQGGEEGLLDGTTTGGITVQVEGTYIELGKNVISGTPDDRSNPYVGFIRTDLPMDVSRDFNTVVAYCAGTEDAYAGRVELAKARDASEINVYDYHFTADFYYAEFKTRVNLTMYFNEDGTGRITITHPTTSQEIVCATFTYSVSKNTANGYDEITISSVTPGTDTYSIQFSCSYITFTYSDLSFRTSTNASWTITNNQTQTSTMITYVLSGFTAQANN